MNPDEHQQAWHTDKSQGCITLDADGLRSELQRSRRDFQSTVFWRDCGEVGVALLLLPFWFLMGAMLSLPWTWYLTIPALAWTIGFTLVYRTRHKQKSSAPNESLLQSTKNSLTEVKAQIWLLRNVLWWYLLPLTFSIMAFFVHCFWQSSSVWWEFPVAVSGSGLILFVLYGWMYRMNQRAVREQLEPRRQDLLKLVASLEDETTSEDSDDIIDLVSGLADPVRKCGLNSGWVENWNRMIPSWREASAIILPTLGGAFCGLWSPFDELGPVFFQAVVGAVIPFEIALVCVALWSGRKQARSPSANRGPKTPASRVHPENSADSESQLLPRAPAILILVLTVFLGIVAFVTVFRFIGDSQFMGASQSMGDSPREPEFDDVSAFGDSDVSRVEAWLQQQVELAKYPSLCVAVVRDGEIVYQGAFGLEDIKASKQATPQTQYHVASVTKAFTASLAVILHERGVVDLDQPAVKYLPEGVAISTTPELGAKIALRQLASHTSGLPKGVPGQVQSVEGWYELEPQRLYDLLAKVKLDSDPGTEERYSNLGFGLLGHSLECAADKPFDRLLQELVCEPLELTRTAIQVDDSLRPATGYDGSSWRFETTHSLRERLAGSGGLVTSVEDLAKFLAAQMEPGVFSSEMLEQFHEQSALADGLKVGTALGWSVSWNDYVGRTLNKNGGRSNCSAWIGFASEHRVGVVVVTNCGGPDVDPIGRWLLERSVPGAHQPIRKYGYARVAPYSGVRWENDRPIVRVQGKWSALVAIDGIPIDRILEFANKEFGEKARKRIAEDLIQVLSTMGHDPQWEVTLGLKTGDGPVEHLKIRMTEENRNLLRK